MKIVVFILFVLLTACATQNVQAYRTANKPLAQSGQMKWSDYYLGLYSEADKTNAPGKGDYLSIVNSLISASKKYENGEISKSEFEDYQREANADVAKLDGNIQASGASRPLSCTTYEFGGATRTDCR